MFELRDPVSSGTHLFTCLWAIFVTLMLRRLTVGDRVKRLSVTVFGLSMVLLYFLSGLFHALMLPREQLRIFQKLDQSAIYLLIAGSYTPVMAVLLTGRWRRFLLKGIWLLALIGIACMWLLPKALHSVTVALYLGMGWFGMLGLWQYYKATGWRGMVWAIGGAFFYTLGAVFELLQWPVLWPGVIGGHEMLHISDMVGTYCEVVFVMRFVLAYQATAGAILATQHREAISDAA